MADSPTTFEVVVGIDGSDAALPAAAWAAAEARARRCRLVALHAWHVPAFAYSSPGYVPVESDWVAAEANQLVEDAVAKVAGPDYEVETRIAEGAAADQLVRVAAEPQVGMVVVGRRGHGPVASMLLGSVSHSVSHRSPKPVVIVPTAGPTETPVVRHIVVGIDGSETGWPALQWAATEAAIHDAVLEVIVAWSAAGHQHTDKDTHGRPSTREAARDIVAYARERLDRLGVGGELREVEGVPSAALLEAARAADLLVVGTRRRGAAREILLGSTSHDCVLRCPVPLAVIPPGA